MRPSVHAVVSLVLAAWLGSQASPARAQAPAEAAPPPTASPSAASAPASATASSAAPTSPPASSSATPRGLVVLVQGDDPEASAGCRELAKKVYRSDRLRPSLGEASARALCGARASEPAEAAALAELRLALTTPLDGAGARAVLEAVARRLPAEGLLVVERAGEELSASLLRAEPGSAASTLRAGRTTLALGRVGGALVLSEVTADLERLLGPAPLVEAATSPVAPLTIPPAGGAEQPAGPRRPSTPPPPAPAEESSLTSSPWFWVAVGSVAALGLSILIVSQATDVDEGSVRLQGRVLP